jgi:hypothetical protein
VVHEFPPKLKEFFLLENKKFRNNLFKLDYNFTPWVALDTKLNDCEQYIDLVKNFSKTPSARYIPDDMRKGMICHTLYSYTDRLEFIKNTNDIDALEKLEYKINPDFAEHEGLVNQLINFLPYRKVYLIHINELLPGGYLLPHTDTNNGFWGTGLNEKITIPLHSPIGNYLKLFGVGNVPFVKGQPVRINTYEYEHAAINTSDESRFHLQIVGDPNTDEMKSLTEKSFKKNNIF